MDLEGVPLVERVRRRVRRASLVDRVVVATDDERIADAVDAAGGDVVLTDPASSGTERVAAVAARHRHDLVLNVQGDMPLVEPGHVDAVVNLLLGGAPAATLAVPLADPGSPHVVKVVRDPSGRALYFSRAPIPHRGPWLRHLGIYGFRNDILRRTLSMSATPLEASEGLEQLRWLEHGLHLHVGLVDEAAPSVDTAEDLEVVRALVRRAR